MLFNSYEFLLAFLPATLALYFVTARWVGPRAALAILVAASLFFYGWWNPKYLVLLGFSMVVNFVLGNAIRDAAAPYKKWLLTTGIVGNLALLGWFKYAGFLAESVNAATGLGLPVPGIVLPLAISFFTFQQIAYLADTYYGYVAEKSFLRYSLFVCFFPQLIAGPIVHHTEMLPQFAEPARFRPSCGQPCRRLRHILHRPVQESRPCRHGGALGAIRCSTRPQAARSPASSRPGAAPWPTRFSCTSISPATRTWPSG